MRAPKLLLVLGLSIGAARPAAAQGADGAAATALFQEGRDAAKRGDYTTACRKMEESFRLDPAVGTLLNLADCQEHLGHLATAWQRFQEAVDKLPPADDRLAAVRARVAALVPRLPRLTVSLAPGAPVGTRVTRDGQDMGEASLGTGLPLDPGAHVVVVIAPGREEKRYPVELAERLAERLVVEPGPPEARAPAVPVVAEPPPAPRSDGQLLVIAGGVIGGLGVATLAAAIGTGLALPGKQSTVSAHCGAAVHLGAAQCDATGFAAAQSGKTLTTANTATWIAGGIGVAAGAALVVVGLVRKPSAPVEVGLSAGLGMARLEGRFR